MKPILLFSNFRTGSSDYSYKLAKDNNVEWLPEPHLFPDKLECFEQLMQDKKPFVVKFMPEHLQLNPHYAELLASDCYKIKLTRENKIDQIVSHYIGLMTNIWNSTHVYARGYLYFVPLRLDVVRTAIDVITANDLLLDSMPIDYDEELTYETLCSKGLLGTRHVKIKSPSNINSIRTMVETEYAKYR